jgi:threonine dehydrogenase-like Zn-dependent dehydrogenase
MKALVYTGVGAVEYRDVPKPDASPSLSLVRVEAVGICGSDMHGYHGADPRRVPPLILGHEACGIAESGPFEGQRVTVNPMTTCGRCRYCIEGRDNICPERKLLSIPPHEGAFAEYLSIPAKNLVLVPEGVAPEHAALAEPLACGWHAIRLGAERLSQPLSTARVVILGGGAIGVGAALCALDQGAKDITISDPSPLRRETVKASGPFKVFDPTGDAPEDSTVDLVIDAYGSEASRASATALAAPGGVIAHIGLAGGGAGLDTRKMTLQEITFIGTYTYTMADFHETARAIFDGRLGDFGWIEKRPLSGGASAFKDLDDGKVAAAKVVLIP